MDRVALFVDGANMFYAQRDNKWFIDWKKVYHYFTDNKEVCGAFYFTATPPAGPAGNLERIQKYRRFRGALIYIGYNVIDKEVRVMTDEKSGQVRMKGNLDVELAFRMLAGIDGYSEAVLLGGDVDFVPILEHLKNLGKKVICVGRKEMTSIDIRNVATRFIDLNEIRSRIEKEVRKR